MELSLIFSNIFNFVWAWGAQHGVRAVLIIAAAVFADAVVRSLLSRKKLMPIVDNIGRAKYKNIIIRQQKKRIETIINTLKNILSSAVWVIALVTLLPEFGVNVAPILAGLGLAGLAVGMAAKDLITDFIAGIFIIIEGEYNIGDSVEIGGAKGEVLAISLRRTTLKGKDGTIYIVPNREIKLIKKFSEKISGEETMVEKV